MGEKFDKFKTNIASLAKLGLSATMKQKLIWALVSLVLYNFIAVPVLGTMGIILPLIAIEDAFRYLATIATLGSV